MTHSSGFSVARTARIALVAGLGAMLLGCASQMVQPTATPSTVQSLRTANLTSARAGTFALAPGKDGGLDKSVSMRASSLEPRTGSFSQDLRDRIVAELKASGLYDDASSAVIDAQLTESSVDTGISQGNARLAARFSVTRDGKRVFEKELVVESVWESSFIGAVAIPAAKRGYEGLYPALANKLFADPDFRAALAR